MEQIISFVWLFIGVVVHAVDTFSEWLTARGLSSWLVVIGIIGAYAFKVLNNFTIATEERLEAIEAKLGIEYKPSEDKQNIPWLLLSLWFIAAVYTLGKSLKAEGPLALVGGVLLSGIVLLIWAFCIYAFADEAIRGYLRKKQERRELIQKVLDKQDTR